MFRGVFAVLVVAAASWGSLAWTPAAPAGAVVVVKMVDVSPTEYRFEPADVTVQPGDTVRFQQAGAMPHNVEFREGPAGTTLGTAKMGPFLTKSGETYDVAIDGRFPAGVHKFVCTPHEALGMKGSITVAGK